MWKKTRLDRIHTPNDNDSCNSRKKITITYSKECENTHNGSINIQYDTIKCFQHDEEKIFSKKKSTSTAIAATPTCQT